MQSYFICTYVIICHEQVMLKNENLRIYEKLCVLPGVKIISR